ncbi:MAG TPA: nitrile hydratase subunit beta [Solirubrobacter sp.]|nr:nitrile hydratase subunit beta [Solirubrobacter sp.]
MNGAHDMGGMHGFGPVEPEPDEPWFHAEWERRVFALTLAMGATGEWNIDMSRFAREDRPPADYLSKSYYELWLAGLERLLAERGVLERPPRRVLRAEDVPAVLVRGGPVEREPPRPARFAVGDRVRTRWINPRGHTRLPRYARGREGVIERVHGCHVFPDSNAHGRGEDPQWLYNVRFDDAVSVDAFEPYLEPA